MSLPLHARICRVASSHARMGRGSMHLGRFDRYEEGKITPGCAFEDAVWGVQALSEYDFDMVAGGRSGLLPTSANET